MLTAKARNIALVFNPLAYAVIPLQVLSRLSDSGRSAFTMIVPERFGFSYSTVRCCAVDR